MEKSEKDNGSSELFIHLEYTSGIVLLLSVIAAIIWLTLAIMILINTSGTPTFDWFRQFYT